MTEKLNWDQISRQFDKEWVELLDYDWPDEDINPKSGVVRAHAKTREDFDKLLLQQEPGDCALLFVGEPDVPDNVIFNTFNTITIKPVHA